MKAEVQLQYPNGVAEGDVYHFLLKDNITLPILSADESENITTFLKGKSVSGTPVKASIKDSISGKIARVEGVLIREVNGIYLIPKTILESKPITKTEQVVTNIAEGAKDTINGGVDAVKKFDTEKTLGFTKKQLLVMAITVMVVIKIFK
jgi:hypothetical protein